jgi:lycopene beta-cyclase
LSLNTHFDVIIAGGGCAGLGLAWELTQNSNKSQKQLRILLIDKSLEPSDDKIWCFWDDISLPLKLREHQSWKVLGFRGIGGKKFDELQKHTYCCVRSEHYSKEILQRISLEPDVTLLESQIVGFRSEGTNAYVLTSVGEYSADFVFQSVMNPETFENQNSSIENRDTTEFLTKSNRNQSNYSLSQHFYGIEIECKAGTFNTNVATLMDFEVNQHSETAFMYVLPFSDRHALFEYTLFSQNLLSPETYHFEIERYITRNFALSKDEYKIYRIEKGSIPMRDNAFDMNLAPGIYNIGVLSGVTKPTTGYTFSRIHRINKEISRIILTDLVNPHENLKKILNPSTFRFRLYDILLLSILDESPDQSIRIFSALFKRNSADAILSFLDEKSGILQEMKIFSTLPKRPFLNALWKNRHKLLGHS